MGSGVAFAVTLLAVALRTVLLVKPFARFPLRVGSDILGRHARGSRYRRTQAGDQKRETHASADHTSAHFAWTSKARGFCPVKSYRKRMTSHISSSFRNFSHAGIALSQGPPSSGSPG